MGAEVLAIIRFKNKALRDALQSTGHKSVAQFARVKGLDANRICALACFRESPHRLDGSLTEMASKLADALYMDAEVLFDRDLYKAKFPKVIERAIPVDRFVSLAAAKTELLMAAPDDEPPHFIFVRLCSASRLWTPTCHGLLRLCAQQRCGSAAYLRNKRLPRNLAAGSR